MFIRGIATGIISLVLLLLIGVPSWAGPSVISTPVPSDIGKALGTPPAPQPTAGVTYQQCSVTADKTTIVANGIDAATLTVTVGGVGATGVVNITNALTGATVYNVPAPYKFMSSIPGQFVLFVWRSTDIEACNQINVTAQ